MQTNEIDPFQDSEKRGADMDVVVVLANSNNRLYTLTLVLGSVAAVLAIGLIWYVFSAPVKVFSLEFDREHGAITANPITAFSGDLPDSYKKQVIRDVIESLDTVYTDFNAQSVQLNRAFRHIPRDSPAEHFIREYYNKYKVRTLGTRLTRQAIEIQTPLKLASSGWEVEWVRVDRNLKGKEIKRTRMKAYLSLEVIRPKTEAELIKNPAGIYINELRWVEKDV